MDVGLGSTKIKILFVFIAFFFALNTHAQTIYDGRIGEKAIALFNQDPDNEKEITVDLKMLGIDGKASIFDVWRQKDAGIQSGTFKVRLSPNGVGYFIVESN